MNEHRQGMPPGRENLQGQALIESCLVLMLICLLFAGLFQLSQIFAAREILHHSAARGARAKTVGFNQWMVHKAVRVAAIPNAGRLLEPNIRNENEALRNWLQTLPPGSAWDRALRRLPPSSQAAIERARIPEYLASENRLRAQRILDYERWDTISHHSSTMVVPGTTVANPVIRVVVQQALPLWVPLHRAFYADDSIQLNAAAYLEDHQSLYLIPRGW